MCEMKRSEIFSPGDLGLEKQQIGWQKIRDQTLGLLAHDIQGALTPLDGYLELLLDPDFSASSDLKQKQTVIFENMLLATRQLSMYGDYLSLLISQGQSNLQTQKQISCLSICIESMNQRLAPFFKECSISLQVLEMQSGLYTHLGQLPLTILLRIIIIRILKQAQSTTEITLKLSKVSANRLKKHLLFPLQSHQLWASFVSHETLDTQNFIQCRFQYRGFALELEHWKPLAQGIEILSPYLQKSFQELDLGLLHQLLSDFKLVLYIESHPDVGAILDLYLPLYETAGRI